MARINIQSLELGVIEKIILIKALFLLLEKSAGERIQRCD